MSGDILALAVVAAGVLYFTIRDGLARRERERRLRAALQRVPHE